MSTAANNEAVRGLEFAVAITKACAAAGITDPAEIPALIEYARSAEQFGAALGDYQRAQQDYNRFIATHGADDPGQDEYVRIITGAREIYHVAQRAHAIALCTWRAARGLEDLRALVAA